MVAINPTFCLRFKFFHVIDIEFSERLHLFPTSIFVGPLQCTMSFSLRFPLDKTYHGCLLFPKLGANPGESAFMAGTRPRYSAPSKTMGISHINLQISFPNLLPLSCFLKSFNKRSLAKYGKCPLFFPAETSFERKLPIQRA